ncbi:hypothetical protein [Winogradskyella sp. Asnod2-B02-A]|uniref:hypothetical protein n=1 Tax=Winogradskyella sp. Asnod2-B02-A TaxID=3160583 RepID=UPI00386C5D11
MKLWILALTIIGFMLGTILVSCGVSSKRNIISEQKNIKEVNNNLKLKKTNTQKQIKVTEKVDWEEFNKDAQIAIKERESQIEEIRKEILIIRKNEQQKFNTALDALEQKKNNLKKSLADINKKLKTNLNNVNESDKVLKTAFEHAFVNDMNALLVGLRDFWKTNN